MSHDQLIEHLLEEMLDSQRPVEEVCKETPELIHEVRQRWNEIQNLNNHLEAIFPSSDSTSIRPGISRYSVSDKLPTIDGYEVESMLGRGGMGAVYQARYLKLNRTVAIKMLLAGSFASSDERMRFIREAQLVATLKHPHIVQIHDVGEFEGIPYFTMELVEGGTLAKMLGGVPLPIRQAAEMLQTLCLAVRAAHLNGIIHRDLKPSNILLSDEEVPKISDFGLARHLDDKADLTQTGVRLGTPSYMAPEQMTGSGYIGPSVDIYSLGCVLFEMLTGRPPFQANSAVELQRKVLSEEPVSPSRMNKKVLRDLDTICLKCLHKDPSRRYLSAQDLAADLRRFLNNEPIQSRPVGFTERTLKWIYRHPTAATLSLGFSTILVIGTCFGIWLDRAKSSRQQDASVAIENLLGKVYDFSKVERWQNARLVMTEASSRLKEANSQELTARCKKVESDLGLAEEFERIRQSRASLIVEHKNRRESIYSSLLKEYRQVFQQSGFDPDLDLQHNVRVLQQSQLKDQMLVGLDQWAYAAFMQKQFALQKQLLEIARQASSEGGWPERFRNASLWGHKEQLLQLAEEAERVTPVPPPHQLALMGVLLKQTGAKADSTRLLREALRHHPHDFWLNWEMAFALWSAEKYQEATMYYRIVLALRPENVWIINGYGVNLIYAKQYEDGLFFIRKALDMKPTNSELLHNMVLSLQMAGRGSDSLLESQRQIAAFPENGNVVFSYGTALSKAGRFEEAIPQYEKAIKLNPTNVMAHCNLGVACGRTGRRNEAERAFRKTIELEPSSVLGHIGLCTVLAEQRKYQESIENSDWLIHRLDPGETLTPPGLSQETASIYLLAWIKRSESLMTLGRFTEAIDSMEKSLRLANLYPTQREILKQQLNLCMQCKAVEGKLTAYQSAMELPTDLATCLALAEWFCKCQKQPATASRLYEATFARHPQIKSKPTTPYYYDAACAAVSASFGKGLSTENLSETDKLKLRLQALTWFKKEFESMTQVYQEGKAAEKATIAQIVSNWHENSNLSSVRDQQALDLLPADERQQWRKIWNQLKELAQHDPQFKLQQARLHVSRQEWDQADRIYSQLLKSTPTIEGDAWFDCAAVQLMNENQQGYHHTCEGMLKGHAGIRSYHKARACTLSSVDNSDFKEAVLRFEKELQQQPSTFWVLTELGAIQCRLGHFQQAIPLFERSLILEPKPGAAVLNWCWLAIAHHNLGDIEVAQGWFEKANEWLTRQGTEIPANADKLGLHRHNWLEAHVLRSELRTLLQSSSSK